MSNDIFKFKQFAVHHGKSSLKVTTDAVIFGSWITAQNPKHILDIGTGCGVLALMMAQKYAGAIITAVEIDHDSVVEAKQNVQNSPWANRIEVIHTDFKNWQTDQRFDCIISNPPYFVNSLPSATFQKANAKHDITLTYEQLIKGVAKLLSEDGKAFLMIPTESLSFIYELTLRFSIHLNCKLEVFSFADSKSYIVLISFSRNVAKVEVEQLVIRNADLNYTDAYRTLTGDFYL